MIKSDISGPSNLRSARSSASRSSPASTLGFSPIGLTVATLTRGEILVHLGAMSRKPRSVKRKKSSSTEKDRPVPAKVQKLGASSIAREPERASSPLTEVPMVLSAPPPSKHDVEAKSLLGAAVEQPLAIMPITVWNPPPENAKSPPRKAAELKRKKPKQHPISHSPSPKEWWAPCNTQAPPYQPKAEARLARPEARSWVN